MCNDIEKKTSKDLGNRKNMVWVTKLGQTIKPKDDAHTSSIATTHHTSVTSKGVGKIKKII
jgi:hypothetical protein